MFAPVMKSIRAFLAISVWKKASLAFTATCFQWSSRWLSLLWVYVFLQAYSSQPVSAASLRSA